jgi:hypothetical protein
VWPFVEVGYCARQSMTKICSKNSSNTRSLQTCGPKVDSAWYIIATGRHRHIVPSPNPDMTCTNVTECMQTNLLQGDGWAAAQPARRPVSPHRRTSKRRAPRAPDSTTGPAADPCEAAHGGVDTARQRVRCDPAPQKRRAKRAAAAPPAAQECNTAGHRPCLI